MKKIKLSPEILHSIRSCLPHGAINRIAEETKESATYVARNLNTMKRDYDKDVIESALKIIKGVKSSIETLEKEGYLMD